MNKIFIYTRSAKHLSENKDDVLLKKNKDGKNIFPDGELYFCLSRELSENSDVVVVHSGAPDPNDGLIELDMLLSYLKSVKTKSLKVIFAYFPYCQQDNKFSSGEVNMVRSILDKMIDYYKVDEIVVLDPHFGNREWLNEYPLKVISVIKMIKKEIEQKYKGKILYISPDGGGERRTGILGFKKRRLNSFDIKIVGEEILDAIEKYNTIVVVDDLLETGGTMVKIAEAIRRVNPSVRIVAAITHGVLELGIERVNSYYDDFFVTDSVNNSVSNISIKKLIRDIRDEN